MTPTQKRLADDLGRAMAVVMLSDWCYWVSETQDPAKYGGYVPSRVDRNVPGHSPMIGRGEGSAPLWGKTLAEAQEVCRKANERMGLSDRDVDRILCSSMFPQGKGIE